MHYRAKYTKEVVVEAEDILEAVKKSGEALNEIHHGNVVLEPVYPLVIEQSDDEDKYDE